MQQKEDVEKKTHPSGTEDRWYCRIWKCQERAGGLSPLMNIRIKLFQHRCMNIKYSSCRTDASAVICWLIIKSRSLLSCLQFLWSEITGRSLRLTDKKMWMWNVNINEQFVFLNLGQEASAWRVRVWRWRKRSHCHQCWHNWGWTLCIHVDLHSGVTGRTYKRANWLQASSWTSYATYSIWKFAVFIEWCASCVECQMFYDLMGLNIYFYIYFQ